MTFHACMLRHVTIRILLIRLEKNRWGKIEEKELRLLFYSLISWVNLAPVPQKVSNGKGNKNAYICRRRRKVARIHRVTGQNTKKLFFFNHLFYNRHILSAFTGCLNRAARWLWLFPHFPLRIWGSGTDEKGSQSHKAPKGGIKHPESPHATISHRLCTGDSFLHLRRSKKPPWKMVQPAPRVRHSFSNTFRKGLDSDIGTFQWERAWTPPVQNRSFQPMFLIKEVVTCLKQ